MKAIPIVHLIIIVFSWCLSSANAMASWFGGRRKDNVLPSKPKPNEPSNLPSSSTPSTATEPISFLPRVLTHKENESSSTDPSQSTSFLSKVRRTIRKLVTGEVESGSHLVHHVLFWLTATDAMENVMKDKYCHRFPLFRWTAAAIGGNSSGKDPNRSTRILYTKLFFFARLQPRLLFSIGALLRALQLCTPLVRILDPSIGVGAGIHLCAIVANSRWPKPIILGWATTKWLWMWLGAAREPQQRMYLPIQLAWPEPWERGSKGKVPKK